MRESWEVRGRRGEKGKAELQKVGGECLKITVTTSLVVRINLP